MFVKINFTLIIQTNIQYICNTSLALKATTFRLILIFPPRTNIQSAQNWAMHVVHVCHEGVCLSHPPPHRQTDRQTDIYYRGLLPPDTWAWYHSTFTTHRGDQSYTVYDISLAVAMDVVEYCQQGVMLVKCWKPSSVMNVVVDEHKYATGLTKYQLFDTDRFRNPVFSGDLR